MPFRGTPAWAMPPEVRDTIYQKSSEARHGKYAGTPYWLMSPEVKARACKKISEGRFGENNPNWKGEKVKRISANARARRNYVSPHPCELCGSAKVEHHHKDNNPWNNAPYNIQWLCRRCHMIVDGRMDALLEMNHNRFR